MPTVRPVIVIQGLGRIHFESILGLTTIISACDLRRRSPNAFLAFGLLLQVEQKMYPMPHPPLSLCQWTQPTTCPPYLCAEPQSVRSLIIPRSLVDCCGASACPHGAAPEGEDIFLLPTSVVVMVVVVVTAQLSSQVMRMAARGRPSLLSMQKLLLPLSIGFHLFTLCTRYRRVYCV